MRAAWHESSVESTFFGVTTGVAIVPNGTLIHGVSTGTIRLKEPALTDTTSTSASRLDENLAAAWLTHDLSPSTRVRLGKLGRLMNVAANEVLFREGDASDFLAIVLDGRIALRVRVPERGQVTIMTVEPGDVVGWSAVVPPFRATSTAIGLAPTELAYFQGDTLRAALAEDPQLAAELYPMLLTAVARRLEATRLQLLDLFSHRWVEPW